MKSIDLSRVFVWIDWALKRFFILSDPSETYDSSDPPEMYAFIIPQEEQSTHAGLMLIWSNALKAQAGSEMPCLEFLCGITSLNEVMVWFWKEMYARAMMEKIMEQAFVATPGLDIEEMMDDVHPRVQKAWKETKAKAVRQDWKEDKVVAHFFHRLQDEQPGYESLPGFAEEQSLYVEFIERAATAAPQTRA